MQRALQQHRVTSRELRRSSRSRGSRCYEDRLNAIIYVNPHALEEADARDRERAAGTRARAAPRHPDRAQGQHPDDATCRPPAARWRSQA